MGVEKKMQPYQREFLQFSLDLGVLRFGEFVLKSGRKSPYFFNAGLFHSGAALAKLGEFYAQALLASGLPFDLLYGPAYKGIPLATATSMALAEHHQLDVPYAFNRKEAKDHGEGGTIVGHPLQGKVVIIDDVITSGASVRESLKIIRAQGAQAAGVLIALDRQERGQGQTSAVEEARDQLGLPVFSIVTLGDLVIFLEESSHNSSELQALKTYRKQYGI